MDDYQRQILNIMIISLVYDTDTFVDVEANNWTPIRRGHCICNANVYDKVY